MPLQEAALGDAAVGLLGLTHVHRLILQVHVDDALAHPVVLDRALGDCLLEERVPAQDLDVGDVEGGASGCRPRQRDEQRKGKIYITRPSREASFPKRSSSGDPHRSRGQGARGRADADRSARIRRASATLTHAVRSPGRRARCARPGETRRVFPNRYSRTFLSNSRNFGSVDMGRPVAGAGAGAGAGVGSGTAAGTARNVSPGTA